MLRQPERCGAPNTLLLGSSDRECRPAKVTWPSKPYLDKQNHLPFPHDQINLTHAEPHISCHKQQALPTQIGKRLFFGGLTLTLSES